VHPKGAWRVRGGDVHLHFLDEIPTAGYDYDQRNELAQVTWDRMAEAMRELYGVESGLAGQRDTAGIAE